MAGRLRAQMDPLGASLVNENGQLEKILKHCPHCGMVDYQTVTQGANRSHWNIWTVGGLRCYQCGNCRKHFYGVELQVPLDIEPTELYKRINSMIGSEGLG